MAVEIRPIEPAPAATQASLLADFGSTFTKLAAVERGTGRLLATGAQPTTLGPAGRVRAEVLDGYDAARSALAAALPGTAFTAELACSSAGGGLRLAVVGQERLISAEAGHRVALSAGARVVAVTAGPLDRAAVGGLAAARPDVLLLVGGTDGGDEAVLRHNARRLAGARLRVPIVVAGNAAAREDVVGVLAAGRAPVLPTANVLPDIGELDPGPARAMIRRVFLDHVIGGRRLSRDPRFRALVRAVTPDAVLDGVSALARVLAAADPLAGAVLVVDVGGATTDVYSAVPHLSTEGPARHAVADLPERRTVEGDLGVRWSAPGVVAAAEAGALPVAGLAGPAERLAADPPYLPAGAAEAAVDLRLSTLAATLAVRRHARQVTGYGPRGVTAVIISGGAFRHAAPAARDAALAALLADPGTRGLIGGARVVLDRHYVLAPAGLLATADPDAAAALLRRYLLPATAAGA